MADGASSCGDRRRTAPIGRELEMRRRRPQWSPGNGPSAALSPDCSSRNGRLPVLRLSAGSAWPIHDVPGHCPDRKVTQLTSPQAEMNGSNSAAAPPANIFWMFGENALGGKLLQQRHHQPVDAEYDPPSSSRQSFSSLPEYGAVRSRALPWRRMTGGRRERTVLSADGGMRRARARRVSVSSRCCCMAVSAAAGSRASTAASTAWCRGSDRRWFSRGSGLVVRSEVIITERIACAIWQQEFVVGSPAGRPCGRRDRPSLNWSTSSPARAMASQAALMRAKSSLVPRRAASAAAPGSMMRRTSISRSSCASTFVGRPAVGIGAAPGGEGRDRGDSTPTAG